MHTNISTSLEEQIARLLSIIGQPVRIQILLVIRQQEACVCHLEAALGLRQASISQHLMTLRKAGLVETNREGRHIFYKLCNQQVITLLEEAAKIIGISTDGILHLSLRPIPGCPCPQCSPGISPELSCKKQPK